MDCDGGWGLFANNQKRTSTCIKMLFINIESETYSNFSQYYRYTFKNDQWVTNCTKERNSFRRVKMLNCSKPQKTSSVYFKRQEEKRRRPTLDSSDEIRMCFQTVKVVG